MKEEKCKNPAFFRYTWPGNDESLACVIHAQGIKNVANVIGLHLQFIQLSQKDLMMGLDCASVDNLEDINQTVGLEDK